MHKLLHLQHHSHTAKHLPHHHTSYRALLLLIVLIGSLLIWLNRASAIDYEVSATVPAVLPPGSPQIETPDPETVFSTSDQVEVSGSCTVVIPALIVILMRAGEPIGSGVCQGDGSFRIPITMVLGENIISVKYKTITGEDGPPGQTLYLYYRPSVSSPATPGGSLPGGSGGTGATSLVDAGTPLTIKTVDFVPFALNEKLLLHAEIKGGTPPYSLKIDWGDGSVETFAVGAEGIQNLSHIYTISKPTMAVVMEATDSAGRRTRVHLAAVYKSARPVIGSSTITPEKPSILDRWMTVGLWTGYTAALTALVAIWLHAKHFTVTGAAFITAGKRQRPRSRRRNAYGVVAGVGILVSAGLIVFNSWANSPARSVGVVQRNDGEVAGESVTLSTKPFGTAFFKTAVPINFALKSSIEQTEGPVLVQSLFSGASSSPGSRIADQLAFTVGVLPPEKLDGVSAVMMRSRTGEVYSPVVLDWLPVGARAFTKLSVFFASDTRYAAVVVSGSPDRMSQLQEVVKNIYQSWNWN
jgi:hypothetical protein